VSTYLYTQRSFVVNHLPFGTGIVIPVCGLAWDAGNPLIQSLRNVYNSLTKALFPGLTLCASENGALSTDFWTGANLIIEVDQKPTKEGGR
jgi:hypothetical protein